MIKSIFIISLIFNSLFAYIDINGENSTTGIVSDNYISSKIGGVCNNNCSNVWRYNATTTTNLIKNNYLEFVNPEIWSSNKLKLDKNFTPGNFIDKGIAFFKSQGIDIKYDVFMAIRKVSNTKLTKETITKSGNDFSITNINKENVSRYVNSETVFDSFLFGMIEVNSGLVNAYLYRNRIIKINNNKYHLIELHKVNFLNSLVSRYNEYCKNPENFHFPFIYEPTNFFYAYQEKLTGKSYDIINPNNIYPDNIYIDGTKSGLISIPCKSDKIGNNPYEAIKNIKVFLDSNKVHYFDDNSGFNKTSIINNVSNYFYNNGYSLKIPIMDEKRILQIATSFFSAIMQNNKIESGMIIKTTEAKIDNDYWKVGKCPTHYNKKTLKLNSETYFLSSLTYDMPFSEIEASFNPLNSMEISTFSPIPSFPSSEETLYAFTPDNHVLSHTINKYNSVIGDIFSGDKKSFEETRHYHQKCKSFGFFSFILVIILVVIAIYTLGASLGAASAANTSLWSSLTSVGTLGYTGTAGGILTSTIVSTTAIASFFGVSNLTVLLVSSLAAFNFSGNIWSGSNTPPTPGEMAHQTFNQKIQVLQQADTISSGSKIYLGFSNIKKTLNNTSTKYLGITPKAYTELTDNSFMYDENSIYDYNNQILGFNTEDGINTLYALTFSHSNPSTFPQGYRYYKYQKIYYNPADTSTYIFSDSGNTPVNVSIIENSLLNNMYGYSQGPLDVFNTKEVMEKVLNKLSVGNFSKYEN